MFCFWIVDDLRKLEKMRGLGTGQMFLFRTNSQVNKHTGLKSKLTFAPPRHCEKILLATYGSGYRTKILLMAREYKSSPHMQYLIFRFATKLIGQIRERFLPISRAITFFDSDFFFIPHRCFTICKQCKTLKMITFM